jgi:hypothetical protein
VTPAQEQELDRAKRLFSQKVDRLRKSREKLHKAMAEVEHDMILCLAAAEDILDDKEEG